MKNSSAISRLLIGTALCVPFAGALHAQSLVDITEEELAGKSQECQTLAQDYEGSDDPTVVPEDDVINAINQDNAQECSSLQQEIVNTTGEDQTTEQSETETTSEEVDLSEDATIQGEAEVTVPDPDVDVDVPAPDVEVTQQPPQVNITQQPSDLQVEQERPSISVEIPEIVVRVQIPAPQFYMLEQDPQVDVSSQDPDVQVEQGDPNVSVSQGDPQLDLELGDDADATDGSQVSADSSEADSDQNVDAQVDASSPDAQVEIADAEGQPEVSVESAAPTVSYQSPEPEVRVMMAEQPTIEIEQTGESSITMETQEEREQRLQQQSAQAQEQPADSSAQATEESEASASGNTMTVGELQDMTVVTTNGEDLGSPVAFIEVNGETSLVLNSGGFLGLGAKQVSVPMSRVSVEGEELILQTLTESEIEDAEDFQYDSNLELPEDQEITIGGQ